MFKSQSPLILIIDDQLEIAELLELLLEDEGYRTLLCTEGEAALAMIEEYKPDLIMLDVNMPVVSGWQILRDLRQNLTSLQTPVIMMTAATNTPEVFDRLESHHADLLNKPFNNHDMLNQVKNLLVNCSTSLL